MLAIPLITTGGSEAYGALSVDSVRPYLFKGFRAGKVESDLENSLLPYIQLITLTLETLLNGDLQELLAGETSKPQRDEE